MTTAEAVARFTNHDNLFHINYFIIQKRVHFLTVLFVLMNVLFALSEKVMLIYSLSQISKPVELFSSTGCCLSNQRDGSDDSLTVKYRKTGGLLMNE